MNKFHDKISNISAFFSDYSQVEDNLIIILIIYHNWLSQSPIMIELHVLVLVTLIQLTVIINSHHVHGEYVEIKQQWYPKIKFLRFLLLLFYSFFFNFLSSLENIYSKSSRNFSPLFFFFFFPLEQRLRTVENKIIVKE